MAFAAHAVAKILKTRALSRVGNRLHWPALITERRGLYGYREKRVVRLEREYACTVTERRWLYGYRENRLVR